MSNIIMSILGILFVFGLLIAGHEFGHFIVAKLSGVRVLEFSLGMGPRLLGFNGKETKYSLRLFPIGGYVKMLGEEEESTAPEAFCNKSPWKRIPIIIAGAMMNFIMAIILFTIVFYNTGIVMTDTNYVLVGRVEKGYPAYTAGLRENDRILYLNDKKVNNWNELVQLIQNNGENEFSLTIERNENKSKIFIKPVYESNQKQYLIGIGPARIKGDLYLSLKEGLLETGNSIKQMFMFFGSIFKGKVTINDVGGPVLIAKIIGQSVEYGFMSLLYIAAFLSVNLGFFNLLPFPALDGGWVVILLIEGITKKKIDENKLGIINMIGFMILIIFAILVTFKDIIKFKSY